MTSFLTITLEILHEDFSLDCVCSHKIWFSSDEGERSEEGRGWISPPPRSERVFKIPVRIGLMNHLWHLSSISRCAVARDKISEPKGNSPGAK